MQPMRFEALALQPEPPLDRLALALAAEPRVALPVAEPARTALEAELRSLRANLN